MPTLRPITPLAAFEGRTPGSDAERRAALGLAAELRRGGREARIETFWCRPDRALAQAWHVGLALAGGLLAVAAPAYGLALVLVALASMVADALTGRSPGRLLTPERASQNVVSPAPDQRGTAPGPTDPHCPIPRTTLLVIAGYDAARSGLGQGETAKQLRRRVARATGGRAPGWLAWTILLAVWLAGTATARVHGDDGRLLGILQLIPSAALLIALALLLEAGLPRSDPGAPDNAPLAAAAVALGAALAAAPPAHLRVEIVLAGAQEGGSLGLRHHLRAVRRARPGPARLLVLPLSSGRVAPPRRWLGDDSLSPFRAPTAAAELSADRVLERAQLAIDALERHLQAEAKPG